MTAAQATLNVRADGSTADTDDSTLVPARRRRNSPKLF